MAVNRTRRHPIRLDTRGARATLTETAQPSGRVWLQCELRWAGADDRHGHRPLAVLGGCLCLAIAEAQLAATLADAPTAIRHREHGGMHSDTPQGGRWRAQGSCTVEADRDGTAAAALRERLRTLLARHLPTVVAVARTAAEATGRRR